MANGTSVKPNPNSPGCEYFALTANVDPMGGKTVLCSQATGFPSGPSAAFMCIAATEWYTSNLMSSSRLQTTFTGFPVFFESTAASTAKSGNDFLPNAPPSSVTCTVTSSFFNPTACVHPSRQHLPVSVRAHASTCPLHSD